MTTGLWAQWLGEVAGFAGRYNPAELAELAAELDYLYTEGRLPAGARLIAQAEQVGDCWIVVHHATPQEAV